MALDRRGTDTQKHDSFSISPFDFYFVFLLFTRFFLSFFFSGDLGFVFYYYFLDLSMIIILATVDWFISKSTRTIEPNWTPLSLLPPNNRKISKKICCYFRFFFFSFGLLKLSPFSFSFFFWRCRTAHDTTSVEISKHGLILAPTRATK